ncbi:MAG: TspO/MBR family protein [Nitrososphaerales archaeon]
MALIVMVVVNGLAGGTTIIGGKNTAQISDTNPTLITPASYAFSIWGIIYIMLGIFVFYQALSNQRAKEFREKVGYLFIASCILNIFWLFLWQFEYLIFSVFVIFLLLATLIAIYLSLEVGKVSLSLNEKIAFQLPFSVYLGWISIASIANVATTLVSVKWDGFGISHEVWASSLIIIVLVITLLVIATKKDVAYGLVIIWALLGIAVNQSEKQDIVIAIGASTIIILATLILSILKNKKTKFLSLLTF